jgi:hypothetical protein
MSEQKGHGPASKPPSRIYCPSVADYTFHFTDDIADIDRFIHATFGIPAGDDPVTRAADHAMYHKSRVPPEHDDRTWFQLTDFAFTYKNLVARPDGGNHAGPGNLDLNLTGFSRDIRQAFPPPENLPQESAIVSKTRSCRTVGLA